MQLETPPTHTHAHSQTHLLLLELSAMCRKGSPSVTGRRWPIAHATVRAQCRDLYSLPPYCQREK